MLFYRKYNGEEEGGKLKVFQATMGKKK